jgi:hypothetical protein
MADPGGTDSDPDHIVDDDFTLADVRSGLAVYL